VPTPCPPPVVGAPSCRAAAHRPPTRRCCITGNKGCRLLASTPWPLRRGTGPARGGGPARGAGPWPRRRPRARPTRGRARAGGTGAGIRPGKRSGAAGSGHRARTPSRDPYTRADEPRLRPRARRLRAALPDAPRPRPDRRQVDSPAWPARRRRSGHRAAARDQASRRRCSRRAARPGARGSSCGRSTQARRAAWTTLTELGARWCRCSCRSRVGRGHTARSCVAGRLRRAASRRRGRGGRGRRGRRRRDGRQRDPRRRPALGVDRRACDRPGPAHRPHVLIRRAVLTPRADPAG
jgi:hypothetical protein